MPQVTTSALILQSFPYGETSRILRLLTPGHGVQSAIAKGVRRPRSRFAGLMEPFAEGNATLYIKETRELQTLGDFELVRSRQALGADLIRFAGASLLAEIVLRTVGEEPNPGLFEFVTRALDRVEAAQSTMAEAAILGEAWQLAAALGFAPGLDACIDCGRTVDSSDDVVFDYASGGIRCSTCRHGMGGRLIPYRALEALRAMVVGGEVHLTKTEGHWWLLARFLDHHVLEGNSLRSFAFLTTALDAERCAN